MKELLSGNEAIARGAWEYGVTVAAAYPGTPSTEILEAFARFPGVYAEWSPNEKVAVDVAVGAAYAGARALATMKHVGLNVAADSLFAVSVSGIEGALVIVSADDPEAHSSQNEQDNRRYAKFARIPCLEATDSQEAKDLVGAACEISHQFDTPVLLRPTTRISHSHSLVEVGERQVASGGPYDLHIDLVKYLSLPAHACLRHVVIEERIKQLGEYAETFAFNRLEMADRKLGIVTNGIAYQHAKEVFPDASYLVLGMTYPVPREMIRRLAREVEQLIVIEELDPCTEEEIRLMGLPVRGKEIFPITGEFSPQLIRERAIQVGLLPEERRFVMSAPDVGALPPRPPILCPGCPHRGVYYIIHKLDLIVNGDIGCYSLSYQPPLSATHFATCMGASIGMAHGMIKAGIKQRNVAALGDSTFFHTGMPALLNAAYNKSNLVTLILDNRVTAMTGHQENPGSGKTLQGQETVQIEFEPLCRALGIQEVHTVDPYDLAQVESALRQCLDKNEPSVIIAQRECALLPEARKQWQPLRVDTERCIACGQCFRVGCPAIVASEEINSRTKRHKAQIDVLLCTGCEICAQVCKQKAILRRAQLLEEAEA